MEFASRMNCLRIRIDFSTRLGQIARIFFFSLLAVSGLTAQTRWSAVGPAGGDARAFAAVPGHPHHLYLGTTNSWIYESVNGGSSWRRLAKLDASDDLILDHILVDPSNPAILYVAAWKLDYPGGGLWISRDAGRSWSAVAGLAGQSIRAFAEAPSDAKIFFAGTLDGVYRSTDGAASWTLISPPGSREIHEVESLAIDPADPDVIYAGTWHLPWKTTDGGKNWNNIKQGIIDDSDVFSIVIDPVKPQIVFASACSGIYKSRNAGELFKKIQGIPSTARRTRVLKQDPANTETVYAGTTEGLYKTLDGGKTFRRMTNPDVIVNDVFVDPEDTNHVLLATDRGGVLLSNDASVSFAPANEGFSERKVEGLLVDQSGIYAGVVNDKANGGVFVSNDSGKGWKQLSTGLDGRDVYALAKSPDGTIVAGTNRGIFALKTGSGEASWSPRNIIENSLIKTATETHFGTRINVEKRVKETRRELESRIRALDLSGEAWLAATAGGLFTSRDQGATWQGGPVLGSVDYLSISVRGRVMVAARLNGVALSSDGGQSWMPMRVPAKLTRVHSVTFAGDGSIWLGTQEGVYFSRDLGKSWLWIHRFPLSEVDDLYYDAGRDKVFASSRANDQIYLIDPQSAEWTWVQTGYRTNRVRTAGAQLIVASLFDGVVVEPATETAKK